ncbi:MAG: hypothetical protein ACE14L_08025 [Terriglobales bacterium]
MVVRSRSRAEFIFRMAVVVEEADEVVFWLGMLADGGIIPRRRLGPLIDEANQVLQIMSASGNTAARTRNEKSQITNHKSLIHKCRRLASGRKI